MKTVLILLTILFLALFAYAVAYVWCAIENTDDKDMWQ